jgi:hypothetical protein
MSRRFSGAIAIWCALALCAPALAAASSISGTVSDENTKAGIGGMEVCPTPRPYTIETECVETSASGHYELAGLPGGNYLVYFSAWRNNLKYVSEFYKDKRYSYEADLLSLGAAENATLNAELAEGGSISGTVTDENTGLPIEGIFACAIDHEGIPPRCASSDADGEYTLHGLPSGEYRVEFEGNNEVNYLRELYKDAETWAAATKVSVTAPAMTAGIDDELAPGAQILGHVSQVSTGTPLAKVFVCALEPAPGEREGCDTTDSEGNYAIRSLAAGTYLVAFELEYPPFGPPGPSALQWWDGASTEAEADPIEIAPPETRSGIDGQIAKEIFPPPSEEAPQESGSPPPPAPAPVLPAKKCRKGFHRKLVKGKRRCVRKHRHHHQHSRR